MAGVCFARLLWFDSMFYECFLCRIICSTWQPSRRSSVCPLATLVSAAVNRTWPASRKRTAAAGRVEPAAVASARAEEAAVSQAVMLRARAKTTSQVVPCRLLAAFLPNPRRPRRRLGWRGRVLPFSFWRARRTLLRRWVRSGPTTRRRRPRWRRRRCRGRPR